MGGSRVQHGLLCACSGIGSRGGGGVLECSTAYSVPVVVQGVMGGTRVQHGLLGTCSRTGSDGGDSSAARAAWYL